MARLRPADRRLLQRAPVDPRSRPDSLFNQKRERVPKPPGPCRFLMTAGVIFAVTQTRFALDLVPAPLRTCIRLARPSSSTVSTESFQISRFSLSIRQIQIHVSPGGDGNVPLDMFFTRIHRQRINA